MENDYLEQGIFRSMNQLEESNDCIPKSKYQKEPKRASFFDWLQELLSSKVSNPGDPKVKHINNEISNSAFRTPLPPTHIGW